MKKLIFAAILLLSFSAYGQKIETAVNGEKFTLTFDANYLVQRDTASNGTIILSFIPSASFLEDAKERLFSVESRIIHLAAQIQVLQDERGKLKEEKNDLEKIITKVSGGLPASKKAAPKNDNETLVPAPVYDNKTLVPMPVDKPKKRKKQ